MSWIKITQAENIPLREGRAIKLGNDEIAVFNLGERFAAINNRCPHQGGPLADGIVSGNAVVCPLHGWRISLDDGMPIQPPTPICIETYPVKVDQGIVFIDYEPPSARRVQTPCEAEAAA